MSHIIGALRIIWKASPRWSIAWSGLLLAQAILPVASVYLTKRVVDKMVTAIGAGASWEQVRPALVLIALMAGVLLMTELLQGISDWVRTAQLELIQDYIKNLVHQQCAKVDLAFYESPEYYDRLDQARNEAATRPLALLENGGSLIQNGITLIAMAMVLVPYSWWLPLALLVSTLPAFYVVMHFDRRYHHWWQETTADRRWVQYYDIMLTHSLAAAEVRLFGLGGHFQSAYQTLRAQLRSQRLSQMRKQSIGRLGASATALLVSGATMCWMAWRALHGSATLGDLALFYQAFNKGQDLMKALLGNVGKIYTNSLFVGDLFKFLELESSILNPLQPVPAPSTLKEGIRFSGVTFRYPGSRKAALKNFNLFIPAGKTVAIVGANGAGKTTLLKLLCRFYDPECGRIELDGIDLRDFSIEDLWRRITVLFQQPLNYQATAGEIIALGDLEASPCQNEVEAAAQSAGAHEIILRLPLGYDTMLGKWFEGGVELSGGEWQRVNTARAYIRQSPIILLDEPTSFMDSWVEADWFEHLSALAQNKTAIIITHRFTIAMRADLICVVDGGEVVESGNHHELVRLGGVYARSWEAQMRASEANIVNDTSKELYSVTGSEI